VQEDIHLLHGKSMPSKSISLIMEYSQESIETLGNSLNTPLVLRGFWGFFNLS